MGFGRLGIFMNLPGRRIGSKYVGQVSIFQICNNCATNGPTLLQGIYSKKCVNYVSLCTLPAKN